MSREVDITRKGLLIFSSEKPFGYNLVLRPGLLLLKRERAYCQLYSYDLGFYDGANILIDEERYCYLPPEFILNVESEEFKKFYEEEKGVLPE